MAFELAVGVIGISSLAIQLAGSAQKLQTYCHDYSTAPKQVKELVEELQLVKGILEGFSPAQDASSTSGTVSLDDRCKRWCMSIRDDIASVLDELEQSFAQRTHKTKFIFIFKKEKIGEMMGKLERAKSMLLLGRQLGQGESVRRQLDDLSQQSTSLVTGITGLQQSADAAAAGIQDVGHDVANIRASTSALQQETVLLLPRHKEIVQEIRASASSHDNTAAQHSRILNNVQSDLLLANQAIAALRANADSTEQVVAHIPRQFQEHQLTVSEHLQEQRKANAQIFDDFQAWKQRSDHTSQSVERIEDMTASIVRDTKRTEEHMARVATHFYGTPEYVATGATTEQTKTRLAIQLFPPRIEYEYTVTRGSAVQAQSRDASGQGQSKSLSMGTLRQTRDFDLEASHYAVLCSRLSLRPWA
ncbi:hypothetical protein MBLNU230_g5396t1 [Neophaeotheca triangularis]